MRKYRPSLPSVFEANTVASSHGVARQLIHGDDPRASPFQLQPTDAGYQNEIEDRITNELTLLKGMATRVSDGLVEQVDKLRSIHDRTDAIKSKMNAEMNTLVEAIADADFVDLFRLADAMGYQPSAQEKVDRIAIQQSGLGKRDLDTLSGAVHDIASDDENQDLIDFVKHGRSFADLKNMRLGLLACIRRAIEADPKTNLKKLVEHPWHTPPKAPKPTTLPSFLDPSFTAPTVTILHTDVRRALLEHGAVAFKTLEPIHDDEKFHEAFDRLIATFSKLDYDLVHGRSFAALDPQDAECIRHCTDLIHVGSAWAEKGFPQVTLGHKLAASLMATEIPEAIVEEIRLPWDTFLIVVPPGLLDNFVYLAVSGGTLPVRILAGTIMGHVIVETDRGPTVEPHAPFGWTSGWTIDGLRALARPVPVPTECNVINMHDPHRIRRDDPADRQRITTLAHRLILGVLLELMDPRGDGTPAPGVPSRSPKPGDKRDPAPSAWTFELRREVKVDVRPYVAAYLGGRRNSPAVQWMVRGHARRQVCGKGRLGRKTVWIEPYWKGREDLPIAVRSHRLSDKKDSE